jgi:uncharacterized protein (DUF1330 family)
MPAYALAHVHRVTIGPDIQEYIKRIDETLMPFGGRFIVHGGMIEVLEGAWEGHLIIIEFRDLEAARAWYFSPAYQAIAHLRTNNSQGVCVLVDGVERDHRAIDILPALQSYA